jgi:hypothetical protein
MAKAGDKPTPKPLKLYFDSDWLGFERQERIARSALEGLKRRERQQLRQQQLLLESLKRLGAAKRPPNRNPPSSKRKQVKPVQAPIFAKLRDKFPPRGKPPKKMSTSEVCRRIGIDPNKQWRSVNRALGREPKK